MTGALTLADHLVVANATLQDTMIHAHENLQDSVIDSSLSISGINSDFQIKLTQTDQTLRYVAAAFGMAGGLVGYGTGPLVNGLKTSATMFGGAFAASANTPPATVDSTKQMVSPTTAMQSSRTSCKPMDMS